MALLSGAAVLAGCGLLVPHWTYRYRLTVEVETPTGLKAGSSVIEVESRDQGKGFPGPAASGVRSKVRGEAVAIDIAPGQTLFALLRSAGGDVDHAQRIAFAVLAPARQSDDFRERIEALKRTTRTAILRGGDYPMLVRFRDIADPRTVEQVDPANLAASFGPGYTLRRITVQITDEPVTTGIEKRLGWLQALHGSYLHGGSTSRDAPLGLHGGYFSTESF